MKYPSIRKLPFRVRLTLGVMHMAGLGLIVASEIIAILGDFTIGYLIGLVIETLLIGYLLKWTD